MASFGVILFVLLWASIPRLGSHPVSLTTTTREIINILASELNAYRERTGSFPSDNQGLSVLPQDLFLKGVPEQYRPKVISDAWGTPLRYTLVNGKPQIQSAGPDMRFETGDDITN